VFFPEASSTRCTAALLLEMDPIGLVKKKSGERGSAYPLYQYVNDRPYICSSFMSVALSRVFGTAMSGRSRERLELVEKSLPLEAKVSVVPCRGGEFLLKKLFEPLGYEVEIERLDLDENFPEWGEGSYYSLAIKGTVPLKDLLTHLNVLIPVMDGDKHYWVGDDEVAKLLRRGEGWLNDHPAKEDIAHRYLKHRRSLARMALKHLVHEEEPVVEEDEDSPETEGLLEEKLSLNKIRIKMVVEKLIELGAETVIDLGCGEGRLLKQLLSKKRFSKITGLDVSVRALERGSERLRLARMPERQAQRIELLHGSLMYRDKRMEGYDAATVIEVIEHMDTVRLRSFERVLFEHAKPPSIIVTTPNREYNEMFENMPEGDLRHPDHRFEWTRKQFRDWSRRVAEEYGYKVEFHEVGPVEGEYGSPTQMGIFQR
jgi:3' terminal RNA ribose 2'-O-methyltransferase Hen1